MSRPPATRRGAVVETLHGRRIADPYRWLEDPDDAEVRAWVAEQQAATRSWLDQVGARDGIRERLAALWDHPRRGVPWRRGQRWFQLRNTGVQDQDVLVVAEGPEDDGRVLLDPNGLSQDGTVALSGAAGSPDGELLAYATSEAGSDWQTWHVRRVADGVDLDDEVPWSKFSSSAWLADGSGFFYSRYPEPGGGAEDTGALANQTLCLHRLGTPAEDDVTVLAQPEHPQRGFAAQVSDDGAHLLVTISEGTERRTRVHVADLGGRPPDALIWRPLLDEADAAWHPIDVADGELYLLTDRDATRGRVLAVELSRPADPAGWREVVAEGEGAVEDVRLVGGRLLVLALVDACARLTSHLLDGTLEGDVALPGLGTVIGLSGRPQDTVVHLAYTDVTTPTVLCRHDLVTRVTEVLWRGLGLDDDRFTTEQVRVSSTDGAEVPMFLIRRSDLPTPAGQGADGGAVAPLETPTLLYAYGGFGIPVTPTFRVAWLVWLELGGLLAIGCLRGGGEYGEAWHASGKLDQKQHTFDDLAACAEALVDAGWTVPRRLAATGGSNGGLTVTATMCQRPELFGAVVAEVGVLDLLRFHRFTIGRAWTSDYGDPEDPEDFARMLAYSPLHNVWPRTAYPATLVVTGDHDDRVVPAHSYKFAATLQAAQGGEAPVLLRVETRAGHGAGTPTRVLIDQRADVLAFLWRALGMSADDGPDPRSESHADRIHQDHSGRAARTLRPP